MLPRALIRAIDPILCCYRKTFEQHRALMVKHEKLRAQKRGRGGNRKEKDSTQKDKTAATT